LASTSISNVLLLGAGMLEGNKKGGLAMEYAEPRFRTPFPS
jgi:hypothetical protein